MPVTETSSLFFSIRDSENNPSWLNGKTNNSLPQQAMLPWNYLFILWSYSRNFYWLFLKHLNSSCGDALTSFIMEQWDQLLGILDLHFVKEEKVRKGQYKMCNLKTFSPPFSGNKILFPRLSNKFMDWIKKETR